MNVSHVRNDILHIHFDILLLEFLYMVDIYNAQGP